MQNPERNNLSNAASPYLRQHAENPVHWQVWSPESLAAAKAQNRPILLSIGYAACHWCHVMAHESFEDPHVADLMNLHFINIKVDREERPDIDQIYMTALHAMGEQGGWPLTMALTPDGQPFWGGTYFPKLPRFGRPGFIQVLNSIAGAWNDRQDAITQNAQAIGSHIAARLAIDAAPQAISLDVISAFTAHIANLYDLELGGMRGAPKFPGAPFLQRLWLSWLDTGSPVHRDIFIKTVHSIVQGGIYDHLGGGIARYSTDERWLVPHFEKMLYDNAHLIRHLIWAHAATCNALFRVRLEETADWLLREMRLPDGAFAASLDADSDGEEGKFYVWQQSEIEDALGPESGAFMAFYDVTPQGNWEGSSILNRIAKSDEMDEMARHAASREKLLAARAKRVRPDRDDKVLTDWNGLAIRALAEAGRYLQRPEYIAAARGAYDAILASQSGNGRLPHSRLSHAARHPAMSSDYAAMINASIALFEATSDMALLSHAKHWFETLNAFHGDGRGSHFLTAHDANDVILRVRGDQDEAIESATAQIVESLVRLASATNSPELHDSAMAAAEAAFGRMTASGASQAGTINAASLGHSQMSLVIFGPTDDPLHSVARAMPDPRRVDICLKPEAGAAQARSLADYIISGQGAYICYGMHCLPVVTDAGELRNILAKSES